MLPPTLYETPRVVEDLLAGSEKVTGILCWGIFNPFGPTLGILALIGVPERHESLLYLTRINPFHCHNFVYGTVPDSIKDADLNNILVKLSSKHATGKFGVFSDSLPSFVVPLSSQFDFDAFVHTGLAHVGSENVRTHCELLRQIPNNPWVMATVELKLGLVKKLKHGEQSQDDVTSAHFRKAASPEELNEWLSLMLGSGHVSSCVEEMPAAWRGAIDNVQGELKVMDWEPVERLLQKLLFDKT
jgi:hypothetical protein